MAACLNIKRFGPLARFSGLFFAPAFRRGVSGSFYFKAGFSRALGEDMA
jgi:hypothetical protein